MYGKQIVNHIGALGATIRRYLDLGRASRAAKRIDSLDPGALELAGAAVAAEPGQSCPNCGAVLSGPYCLECGQRDRDMRRPVWYLFIDVGDEIFSWDSRVFQTLGPLLFLPGALTRSFWDGKRARHVPPIRLYLFSSLFFFLVVALADVAILKFSLVPEGGDRSHVEHVRQAKEEAAARLREEGLPVPPALKIEAGIGKPRIAESAVAETGTAAEGKDVDAAAETDDVDYDLDVQMFAAIGDSDTNDQAATGIFDDAYKELDEQRTEATETEDQLLAFAARVLHGFERAAQDPQKLNSALNNWIPLTMVVLLPVFAIILRGFYWGKHHRLIKQLVFSLHFHSYIFLILALLIIAQKAWGTAASSWMFFAAVPLYLFLGLRTASQQGWIRTFFKFTVISLVYMILMSLTVTTAVLMGLAEI